jgi:hypothetical protein
MTRQHHYSDATLSEPAWYTDHRNLAAVAHAMLDSDDTPYDACDVLYMLEKPWKFTDTYLQTVTPTQETAVEPAHSGTYGQHNLKKADFVEHFAVGDRVVKVSDDGRALLGRWTGTVVVPTIEDGFVGVHWDGWAPDHFDATDHNDLRKAP